MILLVTSTAAKAKRELAVTEGRLTDPGLFRTLEDTVRQASARQFASGTGWIAPKDGGRPLVDTGTLRDSLTRAGARYQRVVTTGDSVEIDSTVPYAPYQRNDPTKVDKASLERAAVAVMMAYLLEG